jgi:hypothetical protein
MGGAGRLPVVARTLVGLLCGAVVAVAGAKILGEYEFSGSLPFFAGPLFGLVVGEAIVAAGRTRTIVVGGIAALLALGGITWAGWISSGDGLEPVPTLVWVAAALAAVAAFVRTADLRAGHR